MADFTRQKFGSFKTYEITINQTPNNNNNRPPFQRFNNNAPQRKPVLDDGIFNLFFSLVKGQHFDQSIYYGFEYPEYPQLESTFNSASAYVNSLVSAMIGERLISDLEPKISFCAPYANLTIYLKNEPDDSEEIPSERTFTPASVELIDKNITPEHPGYDGMIAFCDLLQLYLKGFIQHLGETVDPNDHTFSLQPYKHIAACVANSDFLFKEKQINKICITMFSFPEVSFAMFRFTLASNIQIDHRIINHYIDSGMFSSYESGIEKKTVYKTIRASGFSSSFFPRDHRPSRLRRTPDLALVPKFKIGEIDFSAQNKS